MVVNSSAISIGRYGQVAVVEHEKVRQTSSYPHLVRGREATVARVLTMTGRISEAASSARRASPVSAMFQRPRVVATSQPCTSQPYNSNPASHPMATVRSPEGNLLLPRELVVVPQRRPPCRYRAGRLVAATAPSGRNEILLFLSPSAKSGLYCDTILGRGSARALEMR